MVTLLSVTAPPLLPPALPHHALHPVSWDKVPFVPPASLVHLTPHRVATGEGGEGLFTGYFEPELRGSFSRGGPYQFPLYAPPHVGSGILSRAQINAGALNGQGLEVMWCDDPVAVFFLHIQGSGKVILPDGRAQRVGFAAKNGLPYTAIGRVLRDRGALAPPITMQRLVAWLEAHPEQAQGVMNENSSYIFFRLLDTGGPVGASGAVLRAEESLAIDNSIWPYGLQVVVATQDPLDPQRPFVRLMRTEDTGSAITGLIRGDIFFGAGERAALQAGAMAHKGQMWVLL